MSIKSIKFLNRKIRLPKKAKLRKLVAKEDHGVIYLSPDRLYNIDGYIDDVVWSLEESMDEFLEI